MVGARLRLVLLLPDLDEACAVKLVGLVSRTSSQVEVTCLAVPTM